MNVFFAGTRIACFIIFFFSSRRRHTRSLRDWSSDVCSSDYVAGEDDLLLDVAELARGHHPAVEAAAEGGARAELALVARRPRRDRVADEEEAAHAVGAAQPGLERPGHHHLVARVLVDVAARLQHRL